MTKFPKNVCFYARATNLEKPVELILAVTFLNSIHKSGQLNECILIQFRQFLISDTVLWLAKGRAYTVSTNANLKHKQFLRTYMHKS